MVCTHLTIHNPVKTTAGIFGLTAIFTTTGKTRTHAHTHKNTYTQALYTRAQICRKHTHMRIHINTKNTHHQLMIGKVRARQRAGLAPTRNVHFCVFAFTGKALRERKVF